MISEKEKEFFERLAVPMALGGIVQGKLRIEYVTDGLCNFVKVNRTDLVAVCNNDFYGDVHPDDTQWVYNMMFRLKTEHIPIDIIIRYKRISKDEYMFLHVLAGWQVLEDGSEMVLFGFDDLRNTNSSISGLFSSYDSTLNEMIYKDAVTGLPNLSMFRQISDEHIKSVWARGKEVVLLYADVNAMHSYNIRYGYEKGDGIMRLIAEILTEEFENALIARGADDHFILLVEYDGQTALEEKINEVNRIIKKRAYGKPEGVRAGAFVLDKKTDPAQAFDNARQALKDIGENKNLVLNIYSNERNDTFWRERYIVENFDNAMTNRWIKVFYQPILKTENDSIVALEGLARWIDPVRGMISPGEFIPILSRHHLMHKLDIYMAEQVCREFDVRIKAGLPIVPVSVNFSAQDFDYIDVPGKLKEVVERFDVRPENIIFEITEQDVAQGAAHFREQLNVIRENGHQMWVDDFGSGYSSLNVFSQYTIDKIKLDMDMLRHLDDNNGANRHIMKALVNMCHDLGISTLAEGVETAEHLKFLKDIGCELVQGFYFFKPQSIEESIYRFKKIGPVLNVEESGL